jgi:hypothetical protein
MHGQTSSIFPLRESGADVVRRNSAAAQAQMCGTDCCCAQPCLHVLNANVMEITVCHRFREKFCGDIFITLLGRPLTVERASYLCNELEVCRKLTRSVESQSNFQRSVES